MNIVYRDVKHGYEKAHANDGGIVVECQSIAEHRHNLYSSIKAAFPDHEVRDHDVNSEDGVSKCDQALQYGMAGCDRYVKEVMEVMGRIEANVGESHGQQWHRRPVGMFPSVPDAIMGRPDSMWRKEATLTDRAPITIWANTGRYGCLDQQSVINRGAAICALLLKLAETRPVQLKAMYLSGTPSSPVKNFAIVVPIDASPMSVAQISWLFCSSSWCTSQFSVGRALLGGSLSGECFIPQHFGNWKIAHDYANPHYLAYEADVRRFLGAADHDIIIPRATDNDNLFCAKPTEWVKLMCDRANAILGEQS